MKFKVYFECCDIVSIDEIEATSEADAVRKWENGYVSEDIKANFGLFFLQSTYADMRLAANQKDCELVVTKIG